VDLRAVTTDHSAKISAIGDSLVCEYRLLSLASFTQPTIHRAPTLALARSILSKPLASHSKLQTSSRHLQRYPHSTSFTSELALTQKTWRLQAHSHPPPRAATHLRLRAPMPPENGMSTLAILSFAGQRVREAQRQACTSKRLTRRVL
jgi:hypothetical protein